jgi:hypothetical protein
METEILSRLRILGPDKIHAFEGTLRPGRHARVDLTALSQFHHPFLVTSLGESGYLLLEETDHFGSLTKSGLGHFPVQVCLPEEVTIEAPRLGLVGFRRTDLMRLAAKYPDQILMTTPSVGGDRPNDVAALRFEFPGESDCDVYLRYDCRTGALPSLDLVFRAVLQAGWYQPNVPCRQPEGLTKAAAFSGFVDLPAFTLDDIKTAAVTGCLFPPHLVSTKASRRILSIDCPMAMLASDISADEKEAFLRELIALRRQNCKTSFYNGQVLILNR